MRQLPAIALVVLSLGLGSCGGGSSDASAGLSGLDQRPANTACVALTGLGSTEVAFKRRYPLLAFDEPVGLYQAPGDTRWYLLEKDGRILRFDDDDAVTEAELFLDLRDRVESAAAPAEYGLLGLAFHPGFANNRRLFVSYTAPPAPGSGDALTSVVAEYTVPANGGAIDPAGERRLLTVPQPFQNHNGGRLVFGPDGMLYIGLGDGGGADDARGNAQNQETLLGSLLRIDVDSGTPYGIPPDNPLVGQTGRDELFAWGLRNPWGWNFDRLTGELWAGDVGQDNWEEVNRIVAGGNYGWPITEGNHCADPGCDTSGLTMPIHEYSHDSGGCSITGGYVYRGNAIPALSGAYLFGDYCAGLSALFDRGARWEPQSLAPSAPPAAAFAERHDGELFIVGADAGIHQITPGAASETANREFPVRLSETGCVDPQDPSRPAPGLIPYDVNAELWSDGAAKGRWLALPDNTTILRDGTGDWEFPPGSVLVKEFRLNDRPIETRLLVRNGNGWAGYSYAWNTELNDAVLVPDGRTETVEGQTWTYPSGRQCMQCHTAAVKGALGPESAQLNRTFTYPSTGRSANQLTTLEHIGAFATPLNAPPDQLPRLANPNNSAAPLADRARAYLHSNCAGCHRTGGTAPTGFDLRFDTPFAETGLCDVPPQMSDLAAGIRLIAPGEPDRSVLLLRMQRRDQTGMPPLGTHRVDPDAVALITDWIGAMEGCQ